MAGPEGIGPEGIGPDGIGPDGIGPDGIGPGPGDRPPVALPPDEPNPWRTTATRPVYENAWISVRHDEVVRPDGQPGIYGVVHFRSRAVAVVPIHDDGTTWLVGQYRYTLDRYSWEVPEGGVPFDEDLVDGARRELAEEVGLTATHLEVLGGEVHLSNSVSDEVGHVLVATGLTEGDAAPEGTEQLRQIRLPLDDAVRLADEGRVTDALAIVALHRAAAWWRERAGRS